MRTVFIMLVITSLFVSCSKEDDHLEIAKSSKEDDKQELVNLYIKIQNLSESVPCTDNSMWRFVPIGTAICGGPANYIAYATSIDTEMFLGLVEQYTKLQQAYQGKWQADVFGPCVFLTAPKSVECKDEKPVLNY